MKKIKILLPLLLVSSMFVFTGCNKERLSDIENSAESFLQAADNAEIETVLEFCTETALTQMDLDALDPLYSVSSFFSGVGYDRSVFSEETLASVDAFGQYLADAVIQGYTIDKVSEKDGIGYVNATITTFDSDALTGLTDDVFQEELTNLITNYQNEHMNDLSVIYIKEGEDAMLIHILDGTIPEIIDIMQENVESYVLEDIQLTLTLEMINDKWMVTGATMTE